MTIPVPDPAKPLREQGDLLLLAMCIFGEARGQGAQGRLGVGWSIRNRVLARRNEQGLRFGKGWSGVILRLAAYSCMLPSDVNYKKLFRPLQYEAPGVWQACYGAAKLSIAGAGTDPSSGATHYYDDSIPPPWWAKAAVIKAGRMLPTVKIGRLNFFFEP